MHDSRSVAGRGGSLKPQKTACGGKKSGKFKLG